MGQGIPVGSLSTSSTIPSLSTKHYNIILFFLSFIPLFLFHFWAHFIPQEQLGEKSGPKLHSFSLLHQGFDRKTELIKVKTPYNERFYDGRKTHLSLTGNYHRQILALDADFKIIVTELSDYDGTPN